MSYNNYKKAMDLAKHCDGYFVGKGISGEIIKNAQEKLGIIFSKQLYEYLNRFSFLEFFRT